MDEEPAKRSKLAYETTRKREFKESWKKDFWWVMYDATLNKMYCGVCKEFSTHAEGNSFFVGTASFRIQNLKAHITCQKAKCARENPTSTPMNLAIRHMETETRDKMRKLFNIAYFVVKEEIPFANSQRYVSFVKKMKYSWVKPTLMIMLAEHSLSAYQIL